MTTAKRLIAAASALLDAGGEEAATLRAVGHAVGVSHNAPYKHFKDRGPASGTEATTRFLDLAAYLRAAR